MFTIKRYVIFDILFHSNIEYSHKIKVYDVEITFSIYKLIIYLIKYFLTFET